MGGTAAWDTEGVFLTPLWACAVARWLVRVQRACVRMCACACLRARVRARMCACVCACVEGEGDKIVFCGAPKIHFGGWHALLRVCV